MAGVDAGDEDEFLGDRGGGREDDDADGCKEITECLSSAGTRAPKQP
jgi:hypothetical protein